jgi:drug/metabolite transporter (DMT)-like permease
MMSLGLLVGIVSYGMSLWLYITAQRHLGAAKTSAFYAFAPFLGSLLSWLFFFEVPELSFYIGFMLMMIGALLSL